VTLIWGSDESALMDGPPLMVAEGSPKYLDCQPRLSSVTTVFHSLIHV